MASPRPISYAPRSPAPWPETFPARAALNGFALQGGGYALRRPLRRSTRVGQQGLSVLVATHCCWAASRIEPAVRNAGFSQWAGLMGRLAARRSTIRASALWVAYGIIKRLALALSP